MTPPRRERARDDRVQVGGAGQLLTQAFAWFSRATWTKIATGLAGLAVMLMGYFGLDSRVSDLEGLDRRVRKALVTQDQIEKTQTDLGRFIERSVREGILRGRENLADGIAARVVRRLRANR